MFKVNSRSIRRCSGVFIVSFEYIKHVFLKFFLLFLNMEMTDRMLYCLDLNLSTSYFRVGSRNPVLFKTKLFVTSLSNSFQPICIFCLKELHLRCFIGLELNIVTSRKIAKSIGVTPMFGLNLGKILVGHPHHQVEPFENMENSSS